MGVDPSDGGRLRGMAAAAVLALGYCSPAGAQTCGLTFVTGPSGSLTDPSIEIGDPMGGAYTLLSADLSGSGRPELILGIGSGPPEKQSLPPRILRPNTAGTGLVDVTRALLGAGALPGMEHPREIVTADFNQDGIQDIFFAAHGLDAAPFAGERNVLLLSAANGTYTDHSQALPVLPDFSHSATVGDVNGDGYQDIFVGNFPTPQPPYLLLGGAGGTFTQSTSGLPDDILVTNGNTILSSLLVDLDGDRVAELVLGKGVDPDTNTVLWNDGAGNFKLRPRTLLPDAPFGADGNTDDIVALDINDDGLSDLAIITTQTLAKQDIGFGLQLLVNQGNGVFADQSQARLGASASRTNGKWWTFLRVADLNLDGWDDFYAVGNAEFGVPVPMVWINQANGTFCAADNTAFFPEPFPVETTDVDGDGRLDFVLAFYNFFGSGLEYKTYLNRTPPSLRSISVGNATQVEGNAGTVQAQFPVTLSQPAAGEVVFDAYTDPGTAAPGRDYNSAAAIGLKIPAGQTSVNFPVTVLGDTEVEGHETFTLNLANVRHAAVAREQGVGRIGNDDLAGLAIADASIAEGNGGQLTLAFTVSLSRPMPSPVTFDIATSGGSASSGVDFVARSLSGRLLDAGRTRWLFEVPVLGDGNLEADESFQVNITNVTGAFLQDGVATGTITNDDAANLRVNRAARRKPR
jgi:hypothetical protein